MISLDQALDLYIEKLEPLPAERIAPHEGLHRVLAEDASCQVDLPRFDQSAMDGYAFRARDSASGSLPVTGLSVAGRWPAFALEPETAWRIYTGAAIPEGADTVIPQERVSREGDSLTFESAYPSGSNIRYRGEEVRAGTKLADAGQRLDPGLIASLCNGGLKAISVSRRPRIHILITGDEVRPPGSELGAGAIPDSNGAYIQSWLQAHGYPAPAIEYVSDKKHSVTECITAAAESSDLVITTGGASVGDRDFIPGVSGELGFEEVFWKVAQKPGKPLYFGLRGQQPLLGLPGNPGAVLVGMEVHLRTVLDRLQGLSKPGPEWQLARLTHTVAVDRQRDRLVRMQRDQDGDAVIRLQPLGKQDSHMLSNLGTADVLVHLPCRENDYQADEIVRFLVLT